VTSRPRRPGSEALSAARHDLNNMLMGLSGQLELLRDVGPLSTEVRERLNAIARQIDRIRERVADLAEIESN
jgi:signal transduction histidine kinase